MSTPALWPKHPPIQWVPRVNWQRSDVDNAPPPNSEIKNEWSCTAIPSICLHGVYSDNFTPTDSFHDLHTLAEWLPPDVTEYSFGAALTTLLCIFTGQERNMHERHFPAENPGPKARASVVWPIGVSDRGSHTDTIPWASERAFGVSKFEGKLQTPVVAISFLDLWNLLWT